MDSKSRQNDMESPKYLAIINAEGDKKIVFTHSSEGEVLNTWPIYGHQSPEHIHEEILQRIGSRVGFLLVEECDDVQLLAGSIEDGN